MNIGADLVFPLPIKKYSGEVLGGLSLFSVSLSSGCLGLQGCRFYTNASATTTAVGKHLPPVNGVELFHRPTKIE